MDGVLGLEVHDLRVFRIEEIACIEATKLETSRYQSYLADSGK
jgi:hypothetical protein